MSLKCSFLSCHVTGDHWVQLEEEDSQIESSLPRYLATIFGFKETMDATDHNHSPNDHTPTDHTPSDHSPLLFQSPDEELNNQLLDDHLQSITTIAKQQEYAPPPGCVTLNDCNLIGQLVSVLALVTQGEGVTFKLLMRLLIYS